MSFPIGPLEASVTKLSFALLLRDNLTFADALAGDVEVTAGSRTGQRKGTTGAFLFSSLGNGPISLSVRSAPNTPYYLPTDIPVTIPMPSVLWPAFPDITLANPSLDLWDPKQPPAYRTQFLQACLARISQTPVSMSILRSIITCRDCIYERARCAFCAGDFGWSRVSGGPGVSMPRFGRVAATRQTGAARAR